MVRLSAFAILLSAVSLGDAFVVSPAPFVVGHPGTHLQAKRSEDSGGGAAIAKPKVNIGQKTALVTDTKQKVSYKKKSKPAEPEQRMKEDFMEAPMYKVMLLADGGYSEVHCVERLCSIIEDMDEDQASTVFQQAQASGKAMCGKYPMEISELYKEQLLRSDPMIFADIVEENEN